MEVLSLNAIKGFTGADGALVREVAGRSTGLVSHSLAVITHPAGTSSVAHHHTVADEVYYVQSGAGSIEIDGARQPIGPGDVVTIRPGKKHKVCSDGSDLVLIVTCAPAYEVGEVVWDE